MFRFLKVWLRGPASNRQEIDAIVTVAVTDS